MGSHCAAGFAWPDSFSVTRSTKVGQPRLFGGLFGQSPQANSPQRGSGRESKELVCSVAGAEGSYLYFPLVGFVLVAILAILPLVGFATTFWDRVSWGAVSGGDKATWSWMERAGRDNKFVVGFP